ncbi:alpha-galactosidase [Kutzneria albida]|uniref:Alpha-galactosidase n=1 Tax=Kutzneria albida DSM 43870 TaxID=1449976 RepID=W5WGL7_9PSEU|nr:alpha-galactosidase [Kutzneria albida]AHH99721.1 hypothetical protein KALB_6361 [Kutzneria albida DSM 43870]
MARGRLRVLTPAVLGLALLGAVPAHANDGVSQPATNYSSAATPASAIAPVPPMGFNNWARSTCAAQAPLDGSPTASYSFQQYMKDNAKGLVDSGLAAAGYQTITVDDCWMRRTAAGYLHGATTWGGSSQPGFDYELTDYGDYLHGLGLKFGIYESSGTNTCSTTPNTATGSEYHEQDDANSFVYWGVDALKYDNCQTKEPLKTLDGRMSAALATAVGNAAAGGRKTPNVLFNESAPAAYNNGATKFDVMNWVRDHGQQWRVGPDIWNYAASTDPWDKALSGYNFGAYQSFDTTVDLARYQSPGNWNDADMLLIGDNGMSSAEERSQLALWSAMAAPLFISTDARKFTPSYLDAHPDQAAHLRESIRTLGNAEVLAVDQDPLGAGGYRVSGGAARSDGTPSSASGIDLVVKQLADGSRAVVVLNKGSAATNYSLSLSDLGFSGTGCTYSVRDLWAHTDSTSTGTVPLTIGSHDNAMLKVKGCSFAPTGQITVARGDWGKAALCLDNYASGTAANNPVVVYQCTSGANQRWTRNADGTVKLANGLCLTARSGTSTSPVNGASGRFVGVAGCGSAPSSQKWDYTRDGQLKLSGTALCLDVYGGSTSTASTPVDVYTCAAAGSLQNNQTWSAPFIR